MIKSHLLYRILRRHQLSRQFWGWKPNSRNYKNSVSVWKWFSLEASENKCKYIRNYNYGNPFLKVFCFKEIWAVQHFYKIHTCSLNTLYVWYGIYGPHLCIAEASHNERGGQTHDILGWSVYIMIRGISVRAFHHRSIAIRKILKNWTICT